MTHPCSPRWLRPIRFLGAALAVLLVSAAPVLAQQGTVAGVIEDEGGRVLEGAEVHVMGLNLRALSNEEGRFLLNGVPLGPQRLEVRRFGYAAVQQEVQVGTGLTQVTIRLRYSPLALDELVVTGQGSEISRRRLSTNIDVISAEEIQASPATRLDQLLQSSLPGVQVRLASGQPGGTSVMRGRGVVSVSRSTTPVIYVDGVRVDNLNTMAELSMNTSGNRRQGTQTSAIADIPLENIERIEYIPGGAATTLYGSDAANGVIQIFTSKGAPGAARLTVETEMGMESVDARNFHFPETAELLYRPGLTQQYRVTGSGGNQDVTWSFAGSAMDRAGYRIDNNASRNYQARTGVAAEVSDDLRYEGSFSFGWNHYDRTRDGNAGGYTPLWLLEGGRIIALGFNNNLSEMDSAEKAELQAFLERAEALQNYQVEVSRFQTAQTLRYQAMEDLSFHGTIGLDHRSSNERAIETNEFLIHTRVRPAGTDDRGEIENFDRRFLGLTMEAGAQHQLNRGFLSIVTSTGAQLFRNDDDQSARYALNVRDGSETIRGAGTTNADDYYLTVVNYGVYLQQNWGFYDRYFVEAGIRADGNSAFGDQVGTQYYPKLGLIYDLSAEPFFQEAVPSEWVSGIRFRGNYGVAGNFPPPFAHDRTVSFASYLGQQTAGFGQPGNPDLRPEKTHTIEMGGDVEAFSGRMSLQFTWYDARTRDALFLAPSAPSTGESVQLRNVGEIQNTGIELRLAGDVVRTQDLNVNLSAGFNTLHNEVIDAGGSPVFGISGFSSSTVQTVVEEGYPVGYLRGNKGTFGADGLLESVEPLAYLGKPLPDKFGTFGMAVTVGRNLRLNADADWQLGAQMHSFNRQFRFLYGLHDPAIPQATLDAARAPVWLRFFNYFVEDTDYLKIRNISASYTLPRTLPIGWANSVELGVALQNPYGWWSSSFDPESDHSGAASQGAATVGGFNYASDPAPRAFMASVRVRF